MKGIEAESAKIAFRRKKEALVAQLLASGEDLNFTRGFVAGLDFAAKVLDDPAKGAWND